ncbi:bestrophin-3-like [Bradysia coprophila]|uniref:bestrophin-3-like n=1 Tax=Bradysia coprophila TaxID=38358 RepID=UPI00187D8E8B|nr:bestrophin-3-like [Bradysia coprophila]
MTVSYTNRLANASLFGSFWNILFRWRGSVYKLVWIELVAFLLLYYAVNLTCRFTLTTKHTKERFYEWQKYLSSTSESIPISFVLGFYVSLVVDRWWKQFQLLPFPDTMALYISAAISASRADQKEQARLTRRTIMRYIVLAYVVTLMRISLRAKRRFPSYQHVVDAGLMLESEKNIFEDMDNRDPMAKHWMPLVWANNIISTARKQQLIISNHLVQNIMCELADIRQRLNALIGYDTISVPLVYTQVVTLAVYSYFITTLVGRQMLPDPPENIENAPPNFYFPSFVVLEFVFYVGWLKVAEILLNPFGEDEDDIEVNWLIDRHIKVSYMIVDEMHEEYPELERDQHYDEVVPKKLPYTVGAGHYRRHQPKGSAESLRVRNIDASYLSTDQGGDDRKRKKDVKPQTKTEDV